MAKKLPVWIEKEEFIKLIENTISKHHKLAFLLGWGSGLRISEIAGQKNLKSYCCDDYLERSVEKKKDTRLIKYKCKNCNNEVDKTKCKPSKLKDDWDIKPLTVEAINLKAKSMMIRGAKGDKDRVVPLPKGFKNYHLKMLPIKCGVRSLQFAFNNAAIRSGLKQTKPDIHFHSTRHGFASNLVNNGVPINQVQILLGHSNLATTSIYAHANPKDALKSYEDLF